MLGKDEIAEAVRYADARAEELGLPALCEAEDIDLDGLSYVAEQRGLRAAMMLDGQDPGKLSRSQATVVQLPPHIQKLVPFLATVWMDAFFAGRSAKQDEHPWTVGVTASCTRLGSFATHDEAAEFIGKLPAHEEGHYYLDGPER
jgi:hypothetical protein